MPVWAFRVPRLCPKVAPSEAFRAYNVTFYLPFGCFPGPFANHWEQPTVSSLCVSFTKFILAWGGGGLENYSFPEVMKSTWYVCVCVFACVCVRERESPAFCLSLPIKPPVSQVDITDLTVNYKKLKGNFAARLCNHLGNK